MVSRSQVALTIVQYRALRYEIRERYKKKINQYLLLERGDACSGQNNWPFLMSD